MNKNPSPLNLHWSSLISSKSPAREVILPFHDLWPDERLHLIPFRYRPCYLNLERSQILSTLTIKPKSLNIVEVEQTFCELFLTNNFVPDILGKINFSESDPTLLRGSKLPLCLLFKGFEKEKLLSHKCHIFISKLFCRKMICDQIFRSFNIPNITFLIKNFFFCAHWAFL